MRGKMHLMYFGLLCLVASTLALPTISYPSSTSLNDIKEKREEYVNDVGVDKGKALFPGSIRKQSQDESYAKNTDTDDWKEEQEIDEYSNEHEHSKEQEDEEVDIDEVEDEEVDDEEVESEEIEIQEEYDEEDSDDENDDKYSKFEKSVIIKWKIPTSFLLNSLIANMPPEIRAPSAYVYQPSRFPLQNMVHFHPAYVNYH